MKVKRFAQNNDHSKEDFWVEYEDIEGNVTREKVTDNHIQSLWFPWASSMKAIKYEEDGYLVFGYSDEED